MSDHFSSIGLVINAQVRLLMIAIVRQLKESYGSHIHLYCKSEQEAKYYRRFDIDGLFSTITNMEVMGRAMEGTLEDKDTIIEKARQYEELIGTTYNTLAVAHRHVGRGYASGGSGHPRSRQSEQTSYLQMLYGYNAQFDLLKREISEKSISLFIGGTKEVAVIARACGIPMRSLFRSRYASLHYWTPDEYREHPELESVYKSISAPSVDHVLLDGTYEDEKIRRIRLVRDLDITRLISKLGYECLRQVYWTIKGYEKSRGYYLRDKLRLHIRRWRGLRLMSGPSMTRLADLEGIPFVFYPLHTEPELAMGMISPEYFFQLTAISAISRDLPAGMLLAVKESITGVGRRPADFYKQILAHKNVVMLDVLEEGYLVVRKAKAVATISGTAGFEASVQGIPVLSFGRHNLYRFLPHVKIVKDLAKLPEQIREIFDPMFDHEKTRRDGARFLDALIATSFDLEGYDYFHINNFTDRAVDSAYKALVNSLNGVIDSEE